MKVQKASILVNKSNNILGLRLAVEKRGKLYTIDFKSRNILEHIKAWGLSDLPLELVSNKTLDNYICYNEDKVSTFVDYFKIVNPYICFNTITECIDGVSIGYDIFPESKKTIYIGGNFVCFWTPLNNFDWVHFRKEGNILVYQNTSDYYILPSSSLKHKLVKFGEMMTIDLTTGLALKSISTVNNGIFSITKYAYDINLQHWCKVLEIESIKIDGCKKKK